MRNTEQKRMVLYKGTEFKKCYVFTIFGIMLSVLLHYLRIFAVVYLFKENEEQFVSTIVWVALLNTGADIGFFFLWKSLIMQLSFLLGSYRIEASKLILYFPYWGELICRREDIVSAEICSVQCFRGGAKQEVFRIILNGYANEDKSTEVFQNTGIAQRKKAIFFVDALPIQDFLQSNQTDGL